jgi:hypothetical protein
VGELRLTSGPTTRPTLKGSPIRASTEKITRSTRSTSTERGWSRSPPTIRTTAILLGDVRNNNLRVKSSGSFLRPQEDCRSLRIGNPESCAFSGLSFLLRVALCFSGPSSSRPYIHERPRICILRRWVNKTPAGRVTVALSVFGMYVTIQGTNPPRRQADGRTTVSMREEASTVGRALVGRRAVPMDVLR